MTRSMLAIALLVVTSSAVAAPTTYVFDSISKFELGLQATVTGILQGQSTPTTVTWNDDGNSDFSYRTSRCVPVFLTMLEKPGRYVLNLEVDPVASYLGMIGCGLELKI